jgi:hypothetical protein
MAPSLEVDSILEVPGLSKEKISVAVEATDLPESAQNGSLSSTVEVPLRKAAKLDLEDHPIDIKPT